MQITPLTKTHKTRILLAEDNRVNQKFALLLLKKLGYQTDVVSNGAEALQALQSQSYDVVFMDVEMPEMDGLTATRQICEQWAAGERPRIIALTAYARRGDREQCLAAGMDDYITKPIELPKLVQALQKVSDSHQGLHGDEGAGVFPASPRLLDTESEVLDPKIWQSLEKLAGAKANVVLDKIVGDYLEDAPERLQAIQSAIATQDAEALRQAAHSLRSSSANLGAVTLSHLCKELEALAGAGITEVPAEQRVQVEVEYEKVRTALIKQVSKSPIPTSKSAVACPQLP
ncbi:response regulator receiver domain protein [Coleofasciculus chthonoplastes PCC 7420]|uniref:Response regulator receiver domain protein n=1 Tax=Coleofasciculus chthonoplastes PCC 7420 TaxID=118168 RepID=B4VI11_9CYAN|nr:response regulator [Coleofasciculus chthonoplastes]EDX78539.1 response regulator receiver domain protein [Coleofasciculus chthonoplastes PCC 7420]